MSYKHFKRHMHLLLQKFQNISEVTTVNKLKLALFFSVQSDYNEKKIGFG